MANIIFVNAPSDNFFYVREGRCQFRLSEPLAKKGLGFVPPILVAQYASVLEKAGHNVKILDCIAQRITKEDSIKIIKKFNTHIIIIDITTISFNDDIKYVKYIRKNLDLPIIAIGIHGTVEPDSLLGNGIDIVARGEVDFVILDLVNKIGCSKDISRTHNVKGVSFLNKGELVNNPPKKWVEDLDSLPFPSRHLLNQDLYRHPRHRRTRYTIIRSSRGCPFSCNFCQANKMFGKKVRFRSPKNVVDEIEEIVKKCNIKVIHFFDELFTANKEHVLSICDEIKKRKLKIHWFANSRADFVDLEMMKAMKKAGCIGVAIGVESGSQKILNSAKKGIKVETLEKGISICKKAGLLTHAYFIVGFPSETKETIKETRAFIRKTKPDAISFAYLQLFPGTYFYDFAKEKGLIPSYSWKDFVTELNEKGLLIKTEFISLQEIKKEVQIISREFSRNPSFTFHRIKRIKDVGLKNLSFLLKEKLPLIFDGPGVS